MRIHAFHHLYQQRIERSTKPFNARGSKTQRCRYCQIVLADCVCQYQPSITSDCAVVLLLSDNEVLKPSNTGRLILDTIQEGYAFQWSRTEPDSKLLALLKDASYQPIVVFPDEYVEQPERIIGDNLNMTIEDKKPLLIFLDGSWREARRIFRKSPYLDNIPVLSIRPDSISQYLMRRSENEQHLATAEVAALVLDQIGEQQAAKVLQAWFAAFRESYLNSKTRNKPNRDRPELKKYITMMESESQL